MDHHTHTCYAALLRSARVLCSTASVFHGAARLRVKSSLVQLPPPPLSRPSLWAHPRKPRPVTARRQHLSGLCSCASASLRGTQPNPQPPHPCPTFSLGPESLLPCINTGTGLSLPCTHLRRDWLGSPAIRRQRRDWLGSPPSAVCARTGSSSPTSVPGPHPFLPTTARRINRRCALLRRDGGDSSYPTPAPYQRASAAGLPRLPPPLVLVGFLLAC